MLGRDGLEAVVPLGPALPDVHVAELRVTDGTLWVEAKEKENGQQNDSVTTNRPLPGCARSTLCLPGV